MRSGIRRRDLEVADGAGHGPGAERDQQGSRGSWCAFRGVLRFGVWEGKRERLEETWVEQSL